jgi:hypothetical protein
MVRRLSLASLDSGAESPVYVLVPSASAGRGTYANGDAPGWMPPTQVVTVAPRRATTYDMSVIDLQSGRWYVKDIRASTQPMGTQ